MKSYPNVHRVDVRGESGPMGSALISFRPAEEVGMSRHGHTCGTSLVHVLHASLHASIRRLGLGFTGLSHSRILHL